MKFKDFMKSDIGFVIKMCLLALVIVLVMLLVVVKFLDLYTHHGDEVKVPDIRGMYVDEAEIYLQQSGLNLVVIDSTFTTSGKYKTHGTIIEQNPPADANTKNGSVVYTVILSKKNRQVVLPDLHDLSYRQAQVTLRTLNINVDDVQYRPSEYAGLVLGAKYRGEEVEAGFKIPEGSGVVLIVGENGMDTGATTYVPSLAGKTLAEARQCLLDASLILGGVNYDEEVTEANQAAFRVYDQSVAYGNRTFQGARVDIFLSTNPNKKADTNTTEEEFF